MFPGVGVTLRHDLELKIGILAETVIVEASAVRVQTAEATIQRAVTLSDIHTLPQLGRGAIFSILLTKRQRFGFRQVQ